MYGKINNLQNVIETLGLKSYTQQDIMRLGDVSKMSGFVLWLLSKIRSMTGWPFVVTHGFAAVGHSMNSQHYLGNAIDFYFITDILFTDQIHKLINIIKEIQVGKNIGFGAYPDWPLAKNPVPAGFHLDSRGHRARWGRIDRFRAQHIKEINQYIPANGYVSLDTAIQYSMYIDKGG